MSHFSLYLRRYLVTMVVALPLLVFTNACSDDDDPITPSIDEAALLVAELEGPNGDYLNTAAPAIVSAQQVFEDINGSKKFYLIDIRPAAEFAKGRVPGAKNVLIPEVLNHMSSVNVAQYDRIVVICFTGQQAGWMTAILRMSGYNNAFSMKYGMSSWHSDFDIITSKLSSDKEGQFVTTDSPKAAAGNLPAVTTGKATGAEILKARVAEIHADGWSKAAIDIPTVFSNLSQYYIVNYWPMADYTSMGHIPGAIQYTPKADFKLAANLKTLPTNKTIVIYCYTGQTSANVAAILRVMGYDAKTLTYGTNSMIWERMKNAGKTHFNSVVDCMDFDYEK
jgi:rhodanese-related sulfurtransferase